MTELDYGIIDNPTHAQVPFISIGCDHNLQRLGHSTTSHQSLNPLLDLGGALSVSILRDVKVQILHDLPVEH